MSKCIKQELESFKYVVLRPVNEDGQIRVVLTQSPTPLATLTVPADADDDVWLNATIGWRVTATAGVNQVVRFSIYRDNPITGTLIFSALLGGEENFERNYLNSFSHVDNNLPHNSECQTYVLTAQTINAGDAVTIRGPLTFIATVIENKRHHEEKKPEPKYEEKYEPKCEHKCEPKCECKCEPKCKPHHKPYYQSYDFD